MPNTALNCTTSQDFKQLPPTVDTISSQHLKRKAAEAIPSSNPATRSSKRIASAVEAAPPTPLTMDSDEEVDFMSDVNSSDDDNMQDESDNDYGSGDGMSDYSITSPRVVRRVMC